MTTYVFEYRDEDGDDLIARPMRGIPAVMILTGTNGIAVDLDRVEEVVAGIRDAARQAAGQPAAAVDSYDARLTARMSDQAAAELRTRLESGTVARHVVPAASQPDEAGEQPTCAHCGKDVENRGDPSMDGNHHVLWIHVPGGHSICFPQQKDSPRATPAARQPATQQQTDRAAERCTSCEHEAQYHDNGGRCWFTVEWGVPGRDLVCACQLRRMADEAAQ